MEDVQIILSGLWVALMLTYLLGDVLRIFAGDFTPGEVEGREIYSTNVDFNGNVDVASNRYGCLVPDFAVSFDSMGKHHCSHRFVYF